MIRGKAATINLFSKFVIRHAGRLAACWAAVIFVLCATPGEYLPQAFWLELLSVDKLVHLSIFFVLSYLVLVALLKNGFRGRGRGALVLVMAMLLCALYGVAIEYMQAAFFRNRSFDYADMIANSAGVMVSIMMFGRIRRMVTSVYTAASDASDRASKDYR